MFASCFEPVFEGNLDLSRGNLQKREGEKSSVTFIPFSPKKKQYD